MPGNVGGGDRDEFVGGETAGLDATSPEHGKPVFETAGAVRDHRKTLESHALLLGGEGAMIGGDHLERACLKAGPEAILVVFRAERRRHHPAGGGGRRSPSPC